MKTLVDLLRNVKVNMVQGACDTPISSITYDSRDVKSGSMFFAVKGTRVDGHSFIAQVIERVLLLLFVKSFRRLPAIR